MYKHFFILFLIFFSCKAKRNPNALSNEAVPKDMKLDEHVIKITDSSFSLMNGKRILTSVLEYNFDDKILQSTLFSFFKNDSLQNTYQATCDDNGNSIENNDNVKSLTEKKSYKTRDEYGNLTSLKVVEGKKTTIINYKNTYKDGRLITKSVLGSLGDEIESSGYTYDANGKMIESWTKNMFGDFKYMSAYDKKGNLVLSKAFKNAVIFDSTISYYKDSLLIKKEWYESSDGKFYSPTVTEYIYNNENLLIKETERMFDETDYSGYDKLGNWHEKKNIESGSLQSIITRTVVYR